MSVVAQLAESSRQVAFRMLSRSSASAQFYRIENISYGDQKRQQLDLYLPHQWRDDVGVVFLHGGTWQSGDKAEYAFAGQAFARHGIPAAVINYRRYPDVKFPLFIEDVAQALAWLQEQGKTYGFPSRRWILVGHSAGAHMACLVSMDQRYAQQAGFDREAIAGVVCLAGVYSMRPEKDRLYADLFATCAEDGYQAMKPLHFLAKGGIPLLMYHGRKDNMVACRSAERMYKNALLVGHPVTLRVNEGYGHYQPLLDLLSWRRGHPALMRDILQFIRMQTE